jgi:hypothetical protein
MLARRMTNLLLALGLVLHATPVLAQFGKAEDADADARTAAAVDSIHRRRSGDCAGTAGLVDCEAKSQQARIQRAIDESAMKRAAERAAASSAADGIAAGTGPGVLNSEGSNEPDPRIAGPCTAPNWVRVSQAAAGSGEPQFTFTNVGPYPIYFHLASVVSSGNFPPREIRRELERLEIGQSRVLTRRPGPGFAYRYTYLNAAYVIFESGTQTRCAYRDNEAFVQMLPEVCRAANAAQSCLDQAYAEIAEHARRRRGG